VRVCRCGKSAGKAVKVLPQLLRHLPAVAGMRHTLLSGAPGTHHLVQHSTGSIGHSFPCGQHRLQDNAKDLCPGAS
jgi:hypothetical protein